jgi:hydrogenase maturation protease
MNRRVHIIGVGSPFGDDRFGWAAAEALRRRDDINAAPAGSIEISILDRPGALLPMHWRGADGVILLDAVRSGATPGTWHSLEADELNGAGSVCSSHGFGVAATAELARVLGQMPATLVLRGIEVDPSCKEFSLSPVVATALPAFIASIACEALALLKDLPAKKPLMDDNPP